jgi:hypothetical protein
LVTLAEPCLVAVATVALTTTALAVAAQLTNYPRLKSLQTDRPMLAPLGCVVMMMTTTACFQTAYPATEPLNKPDNAVVNSP